MASMNIEWNAVMLAGDRGVNDSLTLSAKVSGKAAAKLQGKMLIERVASALYESRSVKQIYSVGPNEYCLERHNEIYALLEALNIVHVTPDQGPGASALRGLRAAGAYPALLLTCDLPLLSAVLVDEFCCSMEDTDADFVAAAIDYTVIKNRLPDLIKTKYNFAGKAVCFANMFAVLNQNGLKAIDYWRALEHNRKKPLRLIGKINWPDMIKYKLGKLSLQQAALGLSQKLRARVAVKELLFPELAIDVDSGHDYQILNEYLKKL